MSLKQFIVCDKCGKILPFLDVDYDAPDNHVHVCFVSKNGNWSADVDFCPKCTSHFLLFIRDAKTSSLLKAVQRFIEEENGVLAYILSKAPPLSEEAEREGGAGRDALEEVESGE